MDHLVEARCMVLALCAYVVMQANKKTCVSLLERAEMAGMSSVDVGHTFLEESVHLPGCYDYRENSTNWTVPTS